MSKLFWNDWDGGGVEQLIENFEIERDALVGFVILFASYTYEDYSGYAFVLMRRMSDGALFEVNGNHCSCYGLEGQWEPEETDAAAALLRFGEHGALCSDNHGDEASAHMKELLTAISESA